MRPEEVLLPQLVHTASNPARGLDRNNKGTITRFEDYDMSRLGMRENWHDNPTQAEHGFNQNYTPGIAHQPSPLPAYTTPVPQCSGYQASPHSAYIAAVPFIMEAACSSKPKFVFPGLRKYLLMFC